MERLINIGDLVYVPSEVTLYTKSSVMKLANPQNLLITGEKDGNYEVYYEGGAWMIDDSDVYRLGEKSDKIR
jgi:hypothetical protein